jgi:multidrug efflux pump subunit AcrA (membrane-fusion protein)
VQIDNPQNQLRVGMFAEAQLILASRTGVLTLPPGAVRSDGGSSYVFVIDGGKIGRRPVTLGASGMAAGERRVEVVSGLAAGTQVIRADMGNLQSGTPARIASPAAGAK